MRKNQRGFLSSSDEIRAFFIYSSHIVGKHLFSDQGSPLTTSGYAPHRGTYYIASVTDNRHVRNDRRIIGGLRSVIGNQTIRLHEPAAACVKTFYYMVHPKLPGDTSAILISLDSFWCTANSMRVGKTPVTTTFVLRFLRQSTGEVLYTATSRQEDKTNGFTQLLFRKEIEAGLITALKDFENNALLFKK